jgi:hypothetical protein
MIVACILLNNNIQATAVFFTFACPPKVELSLAAMSLQETLTSLLNIVLLSTGNKATTAVLHGSAGNDHFVRIEEVRF